MFVCWSSEGVVKVSFSIKKSLIPISAGVSFNSAAATEEKQQQVNNNIIITQNNLNLI